MRILIVYYSFTGQAQRVAGLMASAVAQAGHQPVLCRVAFADPAEPLAAPVPFAVVGRWSGLTKQGAAAVPITLGTDLTAEAPFDAVFLLSNTWSTRPSAPIQSFLQQSASPVLKGLPVAIGIVCRGFWKQNLKMTRAMVEVAGGHVVATEIFTHAGSWLASTITNVLGMIRPPPVPPRFGPIKLPPFGVSPASCAKVAGFVRAALAASQRPPR